VDPEALAHVAESGLLELLTPEMGGTHVDLAVVAEEHGYAASSLPIADLSIAAWLLDHVDSPAEGGRLTGLALGPDAGLDGEALRLTGVTRPLPAGTLALLRDGLAVHRAFDALGAAARLLDMTVSYAGQREQFGAPIGSFQAVKHHCADMAVAVEAGRASLWTAALALDTAPAAARSRAASAAAAYTKSAAARVAGTALQVHGGIGFTWEHDLHLFLRRIKVDEAFNGSVAEHRAALLGA
jgi:alkylation response protein AidB-like acyl-CoA dehydrogenase